MYKAIVTAEVWRCEHEVHEALARRDEERRQRGAIEELVEQLEQSTDAAEAGEDQTPDRDPIAERIHRRPDLVAGHLGRADLRTAEGDRAGVARGGAPRSSSSTRRLRKPPAESRTGDAGSGERRNHAI